MATPEGSVKARVKRVLDRYEHYRFMPVQTGYGAKTLDFLLCISGRFVAVETKAPGGKPTALQGITIAEMRDAGATVFVIDGDTAELEAYLEKHGVRKPPTSTRQHKTPHGRSPRDRSAATGVPAGKGS